MKKNLLIQVNNKRANERELARDDDEIYIYEIDE